MNQFVRAVVIVVLGFISTCALAVQSAAPLKQSASGARIVNDDGLPRYLVELTRNAADGFPDETPPELTLRFQPWNTGKAKNLVASFEERYGFFATEMTNWVGNSITAYLTPEQLDAIRQDPLVVMVTEDALLDLSAPWYDTSGSGTETIPWG